MVTCVWLVNRINSPDESHSEVSHIRRRTLIVMSILNHLNILVRSVSNVILMVTALPGAHSQMKTEIWWLGVTTFHSPGAQSFTEPEESGGGGGGIWSSLDDSRAVIILAILLSAAAKSPSAIKTFCAGHKTLWSRKAWQKDSDWSKCVFNALSLADHNAEVHRTNDELKHWARRWQIFF